MGDDVDWIDVCCKDQESKKSTRSITTKHVSTSNLPFLALTYPFHHLFHSALYLPRFGSWFDGLNVHFIVQTRVGHIPFLIVL